MKQTAKEKAQELINRYINLFYHPTEQYLDTDEAKQCALIEVDELIIQQERYNNGSFYPSKYWNEVKNEIDNL